MAGYGFPAPWLNGHPIDALEKIDLIDWYSQTDGYYPEARDSDSKNIVLKFFRTQGSILYDDEFHSSDTINYDDLQTRGRVNRVFCAIDMMKKYRAAYEDGADLSKSIIVDFETVWYDYKENILSRELMPTLQQVEGKLKSRSPEDSPVKAFWIEQELRRSKWTFAGQDSSSLYQDDPTAIDNPMDPTIPECNYDTSLAAPLYIPNSQGQALMGSFLAAFGYDLQRQPQDCSWWLGQETQPQQPMALDPTTAIFVPGSSHVPPPKWVLKTVQCQAASVPNSGRPVIIEAPLKVSELVTPGQKEYNWGERDDESWPGDEIFVPLFCRPKQPWSKQQLLGPGHVSPIIDPEAQSQFTARPVPEMRTKDDIHDSGYASGNTSCLTKGYAAATNGNSRERADGEESANEAEKSEHTNDEDAEKLLAYPDHYRMLRYYECNQDCEDCKAEKRTGVFSWLARIDEPGWTWEGRMRARV